MLAHVFQERGSHSHFGKASSVMCRHLTLTHWWERKLHVELCNEISSGLPPVF